MFGLTELLLCCRGAGISATAVLRQEADETVHTVIVGTYPDDPPFSLVRNQTHSAQLIQMRCEGGWSEIQLIAQLADGHASGTGLYESSICSKAMIMSERTKRSHGLG
jgi:hypothetical protein